MRQVKQGTLQDGSLAAALPCRLGIVGTLPNSLVGEAAVDAGCRHGARQAVGGDIAALPCLLVASRELQGAMLRVGPARLLAGTHDVPSTQPPPGSNIPAYGRTLTSEGTAH